MKPSPILKTDFLLAPYVMTQNWRSIIEKLMQERGWNQYDLADRTGYSQPNINTIVKRSTPPAAKALKRLANAFCIPVEQLLVNGEHVPPSGLCVPLLSLSDIPKWLDDESFTVIHWQSLANGVVRSDQAYAFKITSVDMMCNGPHSYPPGCLVIADPEKERVSGSRVFTLLADGRVVFRELQEAAGEHYLIALNDKFPMLTEGSGTRHLGTVICSIYHED